ncbi:hypothetical protein HPGCJGGD_3299 [Methylobacterium haplocladii]|nr:hypothetical protein HPGCJGGD_3299 [Methylobacterium haplocladii]
MSYLRFWAGPKFGLKPDGSETSTARPTGPQIAVPMSPPMFVGTPFSRSSCGSTMEMYNPGVTSAVVLSCPAEKIATALLQKKKPRSRRAWIQGRVRRSGA